MKPIADIRIYRSGTHPIDNKPLHLALRRIAMKLRESGFSLGDFDHLYLSLTTSPCPAASRQPNQPVMENRHGCAPMMCR